MEDDVENTKNAQTRILVAAFITLKFLQKHKEYTYVLEYLLLLQYTIYICHRLSNI